MKGTRLTLKILGHDHLGRGIALYNGKTVHITNPVKTGAEVTVEITTERHVSFIAKTVEEKQ